MPRGRVAVAGTLDPQHRRVADTDWRLEMVEHEIALSVSSEHAHDPLERVIRATLRTRSGTGIAGVPVRFALEGPGSLSHRGRVTVTEGVTDVDGFAWARWSAPRGDGAGESTARVVAGADVEDAQLMLDHFYRTTAVGPFAPAAP